MVKNEPVNTIKGKVGGECPSCKIVRGDWEIKGTCCGRCGHKYDTDPIVSVDSKPE